MFVKLLNGEGYDTIWKDKFNPEIHEAVEEGVIVEPKEEVLIPVVENPTPEQVAENAAIEEAIANEDPNTLENGDRTTSEEPKKKTRKPKKSDEGIDASGVAVGE